MPGILLIGAAVVGAVAVPFLAPAAVEKLGFTTVCVAAGSFAAAWMSAVAVANGGGIASGSAVAVAQSIGAAGLGEAATAVASAVGGAVTAALALLF